MPDKPPIMPVPSIEDLLNFARNQKRIMDLIRAEKARIEAENSLKIKDQTRRTVAQFAQMVREAEKMDKPE
jgi:hypothetical protein